MTFLPVAKFMDKHRYNLITVFTMVHEERLAKNDTPDSARRIRVNIIIITLLHENLAWVIADHLTGLADVRQNRPRILYSVQVFIRAEKWSNQSWVHPHQKEFDKARRAEEDQD